jgi:hypothetical protein
MTVADQAVLVEDIFPDLMSQSMADSGCSRAARAFDRQISAFAAAEPVTS